jgi:hypothetical protein
MLELDSDFELDLVMSLEMDYLDYCMLVLNWLMELLMVA